MDKNSSFIQVKNLSEVYREGLIEHTVLNDMNIEIQQGELLILLGRSGSGKSTFLNLISGIDLPSSGEVIINNRNLTQFSEQENRSSIFWTGSFVRKKRP